MLSKSILKALNEQINHELYSSYLYLSMSAHFQEANLPGFAHWMALQSKEEYEHAMKIFHYITERNGRVVLDVIDKPPTEFKKPLEVMKRVLEHEKKVSGLINRLYEMAVKEKDYPTQVMLQWFITEQVEEEKTAGGIVEQLKMVGDMPAGLIMLDRQLGSRGS
jgi:ferritin